MGEYQPTVSETDLTTIDMTVLIVMTHVSTAESFLLRQCGVNIFSQLLRPGTLFKHERAVYS